MFQRFSCLKILFFFVEKISWKPIMIFVMACVIGIIIVHYQQIIIFNYYSFSFKNISYDTDHRILQSKKWF